MNRGRRAQLVALACGALVGIPALARAQQQDPGTGSVVAQDVNGTLSGRWVIDDDPNATTVTIATGGTVTFSYPSGASHHNVAFGDAQPTSCTGLPTNPFVDGGPGWSGSCRFDRAGTYRFVCSVHPMTMIGTVVVEDQPAATPTATPPPGATPAPTPTPGNPYATPTPEPVQPTLRGAVKLASRQRGTRVRGSVQVRAARSRLEVALSARLPRHRKPAAVGRWRRTITKAGRVAFVVPLNARARGALRERRRLALTVTIALTPPGAHKLTRTLHTTLRRG